MKNRYSLIYEDDTNNKVIVFNFTETENDVYLEQSKTVFDKDEFYNDYKNKKSFKVSRTTLVNIDRITSTFIDANQFSSYLENDIDLDTFNPDNLKIVYKQNKEIVSIKPLFNNRYLREKSFGVVNSHLNVNDQDVFTFANRLLSRKDDGFRNYVIDNYKKSDFKDEDVIENLTRYNRMIVIYPNVSVLGIRCKDSNITIGNFMIKRLSSYKNFREISLLSDEYEKTINKENPKVLKKDKK